MLNQIFVELLDLLGHALDGRFGHFVDELCLVNVGDGGRVQPIVAHANRLARGRVNLPESQARLPLPLHALGRHDDGLAVEEGLGGVEIGGGRKIKAAQQRQVIRPQPHGFDALGNHRFKEAVGGEGRFRRVGDGVQRFPFQAGSGEALDPVGGLLRGQRLAGIGNGSRVGLAQVNGQGFFFCQRVKGRAKGEDAGRGEIVGDQQALLALGHGPVSGNGEGEAAAGQRLGQQELDLLHRLAVLQLLLWSQIILAVGQV